MQALPRYQQYTMREERYGLGEFGKTCREIFSRYGLKYTEVAQAVRYDASYVSKWVNSDLLPGQTAAADICGKIAEQAAASKWTPEAERETCRQELFQELLAAYQADDRRKNGQKQERETAAVPPERSSDRRERLFSHFAQLREQTEEISVTVIGNILCMPEAELIFLMDLNHELGRLQFSRCTVDYFFPETEIGRFQSGVQAVSLLNLFMMQEGIEIRAYRSAVKHMGFMIFADGLRYTAQCRGNSRWIFESFDSEAGSVETALHTIERELLPTSRQIFQTSCLSVAKDEFGLVDRVFWGFHDRMLTGTVQSCFCSRELMEFVEANVPAEKGALLARRRELYLKALEEGQEIRCILYREALDRLAYEGVLTAGGSELQLSHMGRFLYLQELLRLLGKYPNLKVRIVDGYIVREIKHHQLPALFFGKESCSFRSYTGAEEKSCSFVNDTEFGRALRRGFDALWDGGEVPLSDISAVAEGYLDFCAGMV